MINFQRLTADQRETYQSVLLACAPRSCEYSFVNLLCWGLQKAAFREENVLFFSHFGGRSVYPYPIGTGDRRAAVEAVMIDARERGIPLRLVGLKEAECAELESWFPGAFRFRCDRNGADYLYEIRELAELKGRKFQKKRNHVNRFCQLYPDWQVLPLDETTIQEARELAASWYWERKKQNPEEDLLMEGVALNRALRHYRELGLEGIVLKAEGKTVALTVGSRLSEDTFDIHFEKAASETEGAYAVIAREFARYLREKHPEVCWLNREDDMGEEGLRKAKLSWQPHHLEAKYWAILAEDCYPEERLP